MPLVTSGLLGLGLFLWVPTLGSWYWIDEALSIGIAEQPFLSIPGALAQDGSPPLWYLVLHVWSGWFGTGEVATHALSLVYAAGAIPVAVWAGRRLDGVTTGLVAGLLVALSPFVAYFAHETRMYTLVVLLSLVVAVCVVRAFVDGDPRARVGFVASLTALLYTHNWGIYTAVAAAASVGLLAAFGAVERRRLARSAAGAFAAVLALYLPWVPTLLAQLHETGAPWAYTPNPRELIRELAALFRDERILIALGLPALGGLVVLDLRNRSRDALVALVLGVMAGTPVLLGWAAAHVEPSWATRYLAVSLGPVLLLLAMGLVRARLHGLLGLVAAGLLVLQPVTRLQGNLRYPDAAKSDVAVLAERVDGDVRPGDLVVVVQPEALPLAERYLGAGLRYADPVGEVAEPSIMDWRDSRARLDTADADTTLSALVESLAPRERLLLLLPAVRSRPTDTEWVQRIREVGLEYRSSVLRDDRLRVVERYRTGEATEYPFTAVLLERS